jgi:hypothetical protein
MDISETKNTAKEILDVAEEVIGVVASPSTLWLLVLWNCNGGRGFNGYVSNPQVTIAGATGSASGIVNPAWTAENAQVVALQTQAAALAQEIYNLTLQLSNPLNVVNFPSILAQIAKDTTQANNLSNQISAAKKVLAGIPPFL